MAKPQIFISYRRKDTESDADRIREILIKDHNYPRRKVFLDKSDIPLGVPFPFHLRENLRRSDIILALIDDNWEKEIQRRQAEGRNDFVRDELKSAIEDNQLIIPVLLRREQMPAPYVLINAGIGDLADLQGYHIRNYPNSGTRYTDEVRGLISRIENEYKPASNVNIMALAGGVVALLLLSFILFFSQDALERMFSGGETSMPAITAEPAPIETDDDSKSPPAGPIVSIDEQHASTNPYDYMLYVSANDGNADILISEKDGTFARAIASSQSIDKDPAWSPDGQRVAYSANSGSDNLYNLYLVDIDGSNTTRLTQNSGNNYSPSWSSDGNQLVFHSDRNGLTNDLYIISTNGGSANPITQSSNNDTLPTWSPVNNQIAFISQTASGIDIYLTDNSGANPRNLTNTPNVAEQALAWSPDGQIIVYAAPDSATNRVGLYAINVRSGGTPDTLLADSYDNLMPRFTTDGDAILFISNRNGRDGIYQLNLTTEAVSEVLVSAQEDYSHPAFHP